MGVFVRIISEFSQIGLAIARHIVEEHGGEIRLAAEAGRGTTIVVALPL
jgi:signal transduction histidine kinase